MTASVGFFGGGLDTGNLGVGALTVSVIAGLRGSGRIGSVAAFDHSGGVGRRDDTLGGDRFDVTWFGARWSRRVYRADSLLAIRAHRRLGGGFNPASRALGGCDAILDISGGDSLTDLYGSWRYGYVMLPKRIAIENRVPLVLLPQAYGPFKSDRARSVARDVIQRASACWARDARSFGVLRDLLGGTFDPVRHRLGVDVAFGLRAARSECLEKTDAAAWLNKAAGAGPLLGFNVSGLIWNSADGGRGRFGLRADYRRAVLDFLGRALERSGCRVLLVPHVVTPAGHFESDIQACEDVGAALAGRCSGRVLVAPTPEGPGEAKWMISRCDWFCGTRMHATIAALSSGVPAASIAYSDKTLGVFETCGQGEHVHDPRRLDTGELVDRVLDSWERREEARASLAGRLPGVLEQARAQMDEIASTCQAAAEQRRRGRSRRVALDAAS